MSLNSDSGNAVQLPKGTVYALGMLNARALELQAELQQVGGAVATLLAPHVPPGDDPKDWLIAPRQDGTISLVKRPSPPNVPPPAAVEGGMSG